MKWTIAREQPGPGMTSTFEPTGETFEGEHDAVNEHLKALQAEHGACFAAEAVQDDA